MKTIKFRKSERRYADHHAEQFVRALSLNGTDYSVIDDCEVCGKTGNDAKACRFEKACACWRGVPCK
jgi:hypothetical protein